MRGNHCCWPRSRRAHGGDPGEKPGGPKPEDFRISESIMIDFREYMLCTQRGYCTNFKLEAINAENTRIVKTEYFNFYILISWGCHRIRDFVKLLPLQVLCAYVLF